MSQKKYSFFSLISNYEAIMRRIINYIIKIHRKWFYRYFQLLYGPSIYHSTHAISASTHQLSWLRANSTAYPSQNRVESDASARLKYQSPVHSLRSITIRPDSLSHRALLCFLSLSTGPFGQKYSTVELLYLTSLSKAHQITL